MKMLPTKETYKTELKRQLNNAEQQLARYEEIWGPGTDQKPPGEEMEVIRFANVCRHITICAVLANIDAVWAEWGPNQS